MRPIDISALARCQQDDDNYTVCNDLIFDLKAKLPFITFIVLLDSSGPRGPNTTDTDQSSKGKDGSQNQTISKGFLCWAITIVSLVEGYRSPGAIISESELKQSSPVRRSHGASGKTMSVNFA